MASDRLAITESAPAIKFAPQYVAQSLGYFAEERLEVVEGIDAGPGGSWLASNLLTGKADIALGGIWLPMLYKQAGLADDLPFAAVCHVNPAILVGRQPQRDAFDWRQLVGRRVLLALAVTSQWMFLEGVLHEQDIDPGEIRFVKDLHLDTVRELWRAGYGDYFLVEPSNAEELQSEGSHIATTLAASAGSVPWSIYYAPAALLEGTETPVWRFRRAIERATAFLSECPAQDVAAVLAPRFRKNSPATIAGAVEHLRRSGVWRPTVTIERAATLRYAGMMRRYGLLDSDKPVPFVNDDRFFS
jgi:NitT/TauT family transport system substrate-binding protein